MQEDFSVKHTDREKIDQEIQANKNREVYPMVEGVACLEDEGSPFGAERTGMPSRGDSAYGPVATVPSY